MITSQPSITLFMTLLKIAPLAGAISLSNVNFIGYGDQAGTDMELRAPSLHHAIDGADGRNLAGERIDQHGRLRIIRVHPIKKQLLPIWERRFS